MPQAHRHSPSSPSPSPSPSHSHSRLMAATGSTFVFFLLLVSVSVSVSVSAQPQPVPDVEELLQTWNMPVFHIVGVDQTRTVFIFRMNGTDYRNPKLILNRNQTYQFSIDFMNDRAGLTVETAFGLWWNLPNSSNAHDVGAIGNSGCKSNAKPYTFVTTNITNPCIVTYIPTHQRLVTYAVLGKFPPPPIGKLRIRSPSQPYLSFPLEASTFLLPGVFDRQLQMYVDGRLDYYPVLSFLVGVRYSFIISYENELSPFGFGFDPLFSPPRRLSDIGAIGNEFCDTTPRTRDPYTFQTIYKFQPCIISLTFNNISINQQNPFYRVMSSPLIGGIVLVDPLTSGVLSTDATTDLIVPAHDQSTESSSGSQLTGISIGVALFIFAIVCGSIIIIRRRRALLRRVEKESTSAAATNDVEEHQVKVGVHVHVAA